MKFKKILAFSTSLLICCGLINTPQVADFISNSMVANAVEDDSGSCGENCTYSFDSSTGTLTISGTGDMEDYKYLSNTLSYGTGGIKLGGNLSTPWFAYREFIETVIIEDNITSIGDWAFGDCRNLTKIIIPNSITSIGETTFAGCVSLSNISLSNNIISIGKEAFLSCTSLTKITIPNSVTFIGSQVFGFCLSLESVTIPNSVTSISDYAFQDCYKLTNVTIPDSVTCISFNAFQDCTSLTNITIPDSVTSIGGMAFYGCTSLTNITIPDSVTSIVYDAFGNCSSLADVYFKGTEDEWNAIEIGDYNTSLTNATIHYNYTDEEPPVTTTPTETTTKPVTTPTEPVTTTSETTTTPPPSEPVEPVIEDKTLTFGKDTWNFTNTSRYFGKGSHYISNEFYKDLLSKLSNTEKQRVENSKNSNWNGSCYGLATLPILYKEDIFNVSEWQTGAECLHDINAPNDDDTESLINYYYLLQCTDEIQQEISQSLYDETEQEKLQRLIEMASNVKEGGTPVLLCYYGKFYKIYFGGHAVTAYGVEYGSWIKNDTAYNGRILLYDNNCEGFEDNYCLYFNTTSNNWYIPEYEISSTNGGKLGLVTNDIDLINNNGYFDDDSNDVMPNIDYISIMQSVAMNTDFSVQKIQKSDDDWTINGATGEDEIKIFYDFMSNDETQKPNVKIALRDATSGYQFKVDNGTDLIDLDMSYEDSLLSASADNGTSAKFSPDGYVEINSEDSDFSLGMVFNDGYYNLPWYDVNVTGHHSNVASMTKTDDGIILFGDNLVNITVQANNDDISTGVNFSTTENTVLIYEIDENTIGISIDENDDGIFETKIAESPSKGDLNNDNTIDKLDLLLMKKSILNMYSYDAVADLNNDGYINILDLIALKQEILK